MSFVPFQAERTMVRKHRLTESERIVKKWMKEYKKISHRAKWGKRKVREVS